MLSFNNLGRHGRLGNQMFQYAAIKGIARNRGFDFCIPLSFNISEAFDHQLSTHFVMNKEINYQILEQSKYVDLRSDFAFNATVFNFIEDNTDMMGYYQTEKYFYNVKDEIRNDFKFKFTYELPAKEYEYNTLNVRRGDYLPLQNHFPLCSVGYYEKGKKILDSDLPLVVVSDDIEWCKENIKADIYADKSEGIHDLYILAHSQNTIMANSSFSWWGAWLIENPDKKVVAPARWFGPANTHLDTKDLIPDEWIKA